MYAMSEPANSVVTVPRLVALPAPRACEGSEAARADTSSAAATAAERALGRAPIRLDIVTNGLFRSRHLFPTQCIGRTRGILSRRSARHPTPLRPPPSDPMPRRPSHSLYPLPPF